MQKVAYTHPLQYLKSSAKELQSDLFDEPGARIHQDCHRLTRGCGTTYFVEIGLFAVKFVTLPMTVLKAALKAGPDMLGEQKLISPSRVADDKRIIDVAFILQDVRSLFKAGRGVYKALDEIISNPGKTLLTKAGDLKKSSKLYKQNEELAEQNRDWEKALRDTGADDMEEAEKRRH